MGANLEDQGCRGQINKILRSVRLALRSDHRTTQLLSQLLSQEQSYKDNVRSSAAGKQLKQKKSNSQAQLHLPALDLAWTRKSV